MPSAFETAQQVLADVFGFSDFRTAQADIIRAVLSGRDTLAVLPTGGGKSLCYQIPALVFPSCTLVVSPLIALMADQVGGLRQKGVKAFALHSAMTQSEMSAILSQAQRGEVKLLYVAPERLESKKFRDALSQISISLLAVDEAHCVSEWGHDFRPAYRTIPTLFQSRQRVPIIALTATATPDVRADIIKLLDLRNQTEFVRGFDRPNLAFRVEKTPHKIEFLTKLTKVEREKSVLVYAGSRRRVDTITEELRKRGVAASSYHAGRSSVERSFIQQRFIEGETKILVATNAFGLGIDKPDVRHVVHADLTLTLEAYYQEAGRAGRDGMPSTCTLLYQTEDRSLMDFFIKSTYPEAADIDVVTSYLYNISGFINEGTATPIRADEASIAVELHKPQAMIRGVIKVLEQNGVLMRTTSNGLSRLRLRSTVERLHEVVDNAPPERKPAFEAIKRLLATRGMGSETEFAMHSFLMKSGISINEFTMAIRALHAARIIRYTAPETSGGFLLLLPRPKRGSTIIDMIEIHRRRDHAESKLDAVIRYAETAQCKRNFILHYFGDHEVKGRCGRCSSCTATHAKEVIATDDTPILTALIHAAAEVGGRFGRNIIVDIVTATVSAKTLEYHFETASTWGACKDFSRAHVLHVLDNAIGSGLLVKTGVEFPLIAVSPSGAKFGSPLPQSKVFDREREHVSDKSVLAALIKVRDEISDRENTVPTSLVTISQLERLATDKPMDVKDLVVGKHGSAIFLAHHGADIVQAIKRSSSSTNTMEVSVRADELTKYAAGVAIKGRSLADVALRLHLTPAATAQIIQRAIEAGLNVERGQLVSDEVFEKVFDYMRYHRYAKLRHVRENVSAEDIGLPELRIAMAFARRELYREEIQ